MSLARGEFLFFFLFYGALMTPVSPSPPATVRPRLVGVETESGEKQEPAADC
jgi:hypothetical protein